MPKMKTKSSVKRRFKVTKTGKVLRKGANTRHMLINKPKKRKRQARGTHVMSKPDTRIVLRNFFPYKRKKAS
jgi:large subunit ribosomal protein L35